MTPRRTLPPQLSELIAFGCVAVVGLAVDLLVAWRLRALGANLTLAAGTGFVIAALVNYVLHATWTFRGARRLSPAGAGRFVAASGAALVVRLSVVALLSRLVASPGHDLAILVAAVGVSFLFNFVVSRALIFHPPAARDCARRTGHREAERQGDGRDG